MEVRFLHAADLHLDTPFKGVTHFPEEQYAQLRESTFQAFSNLIQYALDTRPDFVVIVGDIYDGEHRSLRAQLKFQEGMEALAKATIPVFLSYGNHDHLQGTWTRFDLPTNVHVFQGEVERKTLSVRGERVNIYGFSYPERHVKEAMIDAYPVAQTDEVHIGLLHGSIAGDHTHAVYAPFTKEALLSKHYDYWALGHIHKRQVLHESPPIVYPGNTQGRHRNEQGEKGFYEVTVSHSKTARKFVPTSTIVFETLEVSCVGVRHVGDWLAICEEALIQCQASYHSSLIVDLKMIDINQEAAELFRQSTQGEWLDVLRETIQSNTPFIWVNDVRFVQSIEGNEAIQSVVSPVTETIAQWTTERWDDVLQDLYQHTRSIPYLERLTKDDLEDIQVEVERTLIEALTDRR